MTLKSVDEANAADIAVERQGALARIVLKRTRALNALDTAMRAVIAKAIAVLARDASLYVVVMRSTSPKAFSAGGDVRELIAWHREDPARARSAFADEYRLNWVLDCFSKPTVSLIDGMVMGSGVGITLYSTHCVAAAGYRFAMPETMIGLFPDVGVVHRLSRLPDEIGTYLGLSGRTIERADAYALGLVSHCIAAEHFDAIEAALADAQPIDTLLDGLHEEPGAAPLAAHAQLIAHCLAPDTVEEIMERLAGVTGEARAFAQGLLADLAKRSPTSLKITLRHLRQARGMDLRQVLITDYRLACRCLQNHDFAEGVRAALIDKDNQPVWRPATLQEVSGELVESYFAPLPPGEDLALASRAEMQSARL